MLLASVGCSFHRGTVYDFTKPGEFGQTITESAQEAYLKRTSTAVSPAIRTNATSLTVRLVSPIMALGNPSFSGNKARVSVYVDGKHYGALTATRAEAQDYTLALPADGQLHEVYFVEGLAMYLTGATFAGTYLVSVTVPEGARSYLIPVKRQPKRIALSTNFIIIGDGTTEPGYTGEVAQLRMLNPSWEIADLGFCGRTATESLATDSLQQAEAQAVVAYLKGAEEKVYALLLVV